MRPLRGIPALLLLLALLAPCLGAGGPARAQSAEGAAPATAEAEPPPSAPPVRAGAAAGRTTTARPAPPLTQEEVEGLTSLLQDEARRAEFLRMLQALAAAGRAQTGTAAEGSVPVVVPPVAAPAGAAARPVAPPPAPAAAPPAAPPGVPPQAAPAASQPPQAGAATGAPPAAPAPATQAGAAPAAAGAAPPPAAAPPAATPPTAAGGTPPPAAGTTPGAAVPPAATPAAPAEGEAPILAPSATGALVLRWLGGLEERLGPVGQELLEAARTMADLPSLWGAVESMLRDAVIRARLADAAWNLLLVIGLGVAADRLSARGLARARGRLNAKAPPGGTAWAWFRRVPLLVARLALDLLPIAAFVLAAFVMMELRQPLPTTQRVALLVGQLYVAARLVFTVARMLLAPESQRLRLVPVSDRAAARGLRWLWRLQVLGLGGYALAQGGLALGLSWAAYDALINLTLLLLSLQLAYMVVRARAGVAAALRAPPLEVGAQPDRGRLALRSLRNGLADVWHVLTILWLLAAWVVWALAVEDGLYRLLLSTLLIGAFGLLMKGIDAGIARAVDRMMGPAAGGAGAAAGPSRAGTWMPLLRTMLGAAVALGGLMVLLEVWGLNTLAWFAPGTLGGRLAGRLLSVGATFVAAALVWEAANAAIARRLARLSRESGGAAARGARVRTLLPMLRTVLGIVIVVFLALSTLAELGVNVAPLLAGAGVVGLAIGFGSQTLVRDVITGVFLLLEDAVAVGDVVTLGGLTGVVEHLTIRSIRLRATDGSVHIVPFSAVTTVTNMTRDFAFAVLDVTVTYDEDPDHVADVLRGIGEEMRADPKFGPMIRDDIDVWGVDKMSDHGVTIRSRVKTGPSSRWPVQRECNRRIRQRFAELGIAMVKPAAGPARLVLEQPGALAPAAPGGAGGVQPPGSAPRAAE